MDRFSGARLCAKQDAADITTTQLAVGIDRAYGTVMKIRRDEIRPSIDTLVRLADFFNCDINDFFEPADHSDPRGSDLGPEADAWIKATLASAPPMTPAIAKRVSAALFGQAAS
jgi:transcriptional regulator with XRE-family HTH domain